jgi:hypothetical protein
MPSHNSPVFIPVMQLRPGCILLYDQFDGYRKSRDGAQTLNFNSKEKPEKYTGKLNEKSKSKLRFALNLLVAQAKWKQVENPTTGKMYKFKVNFITLTLSAPQREVSDKVIKSKMLFPWIRTMRDSHGLRSYVWRAERQKNGNIHFHFTTDTYIPYDSIRDSWNFQQAKFHFIDEFRRKNKSAYPNSTDVHSVMNVRNLASYLVKYMSKDEKGLETIEGKVWDCSTNLKTTERVCFEIDGPTFKMVDSILASKKFRSFDNDHCRIVALSEKDMRSYLPAKMTREYRAWLQRVYDAATPGRVRVV